MIGKIHSPSTNIRKTSAAQRSRMWFQLAQAKHANAESVILDLAKELVRTAQEATREMFVVYHRNIMKHYHLVMTNIAMERSGKIHHFW